MIFKDNMLEIFLCVYEPLFFDSYHLTRECILWMMVDGRWKVLMVDNNNGFQKIKYKDCIVVNHHVFLNF